MTAGDISTNLRTYLLTVSAVTTQASGGIFPDVLPQNPSFPAVVIRVISSTPQHALGQTTQLKMTRFQVDCYAQTRLAANATSEVIRKNLDHYSGAAGDDTIDVSLTETDRYDYEPPKDAGDSRSSGRYLASTEYLIVHDVPAVST